MTITIDWGNTNVISVPQADLTLVSGTLYELDTDAFRLTLKDLEDDEEGMAFPRTHNHNTSVTVAGVTFARTLEILSPYSVVFTPNIQYSVRLVGSNNNIFDVAGGILVQNQVQVIPTNSAGLVTVVSGSGLSVVQDLRLLLLEKLLRNKLVTDPDTGLMTLFDDDDTVLLTADLFEDSLAVQRYRGQGAERRERLT